MSKNLQKMMASKYPNPSTLSNQNLSETSNVTIIKECVLTPKKVMYVIIFLSILFFILSHPKTFEFSRSLFNLNSPSNSTCVIIHTILFALYAFILFRFCC